MPLPSFLKRKPSPAPERRGAPPADGADVQVARTRARRRLIGAAVLLVAGVIGFPVVFDTQPRPVSVDVPIELRGSAASAPGVSLPPRSARSSGVVIADSPVDEEPASAPAAPAPAPAVEPKVEPAPAAAVPAKPASAPAVKPDAAATIAKPASAVAPKPTAAARADAERAKALLDGASAPKEVRFVVQIGAFADTAALNQARSRADKSGLKTYTQVVDTSAGKRTRLRVGPFDSREAADRAAAKLKAAGLPAAVLTL
ncbi:MULTISPECIES: SPOR domain-containing protein [Rubrivivax]|uniref:SPOR domain-containing protein n=1 Tax=Rubrivivax benzoatilyticus TaxID=316997 RepID=A0ABX0HQM4_9BURK|nr:MULTISPECIES: SPOR domain-containing protein [Rubrivivax]MCC9595762.1 SPOR domain-containing protein [Rubrivivax sp. JA1055]MCC9647898.1 SPOR domain-containing protein [Rubrivivax sp. JA1029]NHK97357.1 SPOR domain-containing protein [Rubrivivax benzoatilyticus]NHL22948.1 SPOR domain-containing protein [Rubrivivax benzoatilyticus]